MKLVTFVEAEYPASERAGGKSRAGRSGGSTSAMRSKRPGCFCTRPMPVAQPIDTPHQCARSMPSASISAITSSHNSSNV